MSDPSDAKLDQIKQESKQAEAEHGEGGAGLLDTGDEAAAKDAGKAEQKATEANQEKAAEANQEKADESDDE